MADANGDTPSRANNAAEDGDEAGVDNGTVTPATDQVHPADAPGTLLWVTADGGLRELAVDSASTESVSTFTTESDKSRRARSCRQCDDPVLTEAIVREHVECGHIAADGFVRGDGRFGCPKCGTVAETIDRFRAVARVTACLACGDLVGHRPDA